MTASNWGTPPDLPDTLCYLNGAFTELRNAQVSVLDRGFIFGDGVYEVLPCYGGLAFRFEHHMARLDRSLAELRIRNPHTRDEWLAVARRHAGQIRLHFRAPTGTRIEETARIADALLDAACVDA